MLRRAGWHYYHHDAEEIARQVAAWMGELLGWDGPARDEELGRLHQATR